MRLKTFIAVTGLILAMATIAAGADIAGKWVAEREGPQGIQQTTFNFTVKGAALTGTVSGGRGGDSEITEGKIEGDDISFAVVRTMGDNEMKTLYKGKVSGNEIKFTVERQGGGPGGPGGPGGGQGGPGGGQRGPGGAGGPGGPQEIIAKRAQ